MDIVDTGPPLEYALIMYSLGFAITLEAVYRSGLPLGKMFTTTPEYNWNGILNLLYFAISFWVFTALPYNWFISLTIMFIGVGGGGGVHQLLQNLLGNLRHILFFLSPAFLIGCAYILYLQ